MTIDDRTEWIEPDGLGGFASGTTSGIRTRRYHALLLAATAPPAGRMVLVNGFDAWIDVNGATAALSTQRYAPDVLHPDGHGRIASFSSTPWPTWEFDGPDGLRLRQEILVQRNTGVTVVTWTRLRGPNSVRLLVRPFLSGRDYHSMHHQNESFRFDPDIRGQIVGFTPYGGVPRVEFLSDGEYRPASEWYRQFLYREEQARGLDATEDLASPGEFSWTLTRDQSSAAWVLRTGSAAASQPNVDEVRMMAVSIQDAERSRRSAFLSDLERSADDYLVKRGSGRTIVAGYPWFTDWGRDTFIALRGLCLATGRMADARDILLEWAGAVSEGMLPNRFPDAGEAPEYNSVDASLWYIVAVHEFLEQAGTIAAADDRARLSDAVLRIVSGYASGTRFGIRMDGDGLLAAGEPGVQLTWMDARVGDRVITPRIGKPVEVQALWLNALWIASKIEPHWSSEFARGLASFGRRYWSDDKGYLADVVDVDHRAGTQDMTFRPNQILAIGGLPLALVDGEHAQQIVDAVEARLLTPLGLRSLSPDAPAYAQRYEGGPADRDAVYHQGTVWPWLLGPFVEAWVAARGHTPASKREARRRFLRPLIMHLEEAGLGHVSEIADAEAPFAPKGCPFQAWSLGELIRLDRQVLTEPRRKRRENGGARRVGAMRSTGDQSRSVRTARTDNPRP
jgi:predicted glycogen debranching enzyme